ncbi:MAG: hypothetical protein ABI663_03805 [Chryseolinea sp.]
MISKEKIFRDLFEKSLNASFEAILLTLINAIRQNGHADRQEFLPINEIVKRYDISKRTLYNYHHKGYITLHTTKNIYFNK